MFKFKINEKSLKEMSELEPENGVYAMTVLTLGIKVKKVLPNAVMPVCSSNGAAGFDLTAATETFRQELSGPIFEYDTGLAFEIPQGHVGLVFPRSSISIKTSFTLGNSVGVIDSDYRGTVKFQFRVSHPGKKYNVGDRIGQIIIIPIPAVQFVESDELSNTDRGQGGFGSTGK